MLSPTTMAPTNITGALMIACQGASPRTTPQTTKAMVVGNASAATRQSVAPPNSVPTV